jgi:hypothetical protein
MDTHDDEHGSSSIRSFPMSIDQAAELLGCPVATLEEPTLGLTGPVVASLMGTQAEQFKVVLRYYSENAAILISTTRRDRPSTALVDLKACMAELLLELAQPISPADAPRLNQTASQLLDASVRSVQVTINSRSTAAVSLTHELNVCFGVELPLVNIAIAGEQTHDVRVTWQWPRTDTGDVLGQLLSTPRQR